MSSSPAVALVPNRANSKKKKKLSFRPPSKKSKSPSSVQKRPGGFQKQNKKVTTSKVVDGVGQNPDATHQAPPAASAPAASAPAASAPAASAPAASNPPVLDQRSSPAKTPPQGAKAAPLAKQQPPPAGAKPSSQTKTADKQEQTLSLSKKTAIKKRKRKIQVAGTCVSGTCVSGTSIAGTSVAGTSVAGTSIASVGKQRKSTSTPAAPSKKKETGTLIDEKDEEEQKQPGPPSLLSFCTSFRAKRDGKVQKRDYGTVEAPPAPTPPPPPSEEEPEANKPAGPQVQIIDGEIVLQTSSIMVPNRRKTVAEVEEEFGGQAVVEEEGHTSVVGATYNSFRTTRKPLHWNVQETKKFYDALRQVGTDFMCMEALFDNKRSRKQLKKKYQREMQQNPKLVEMALNPKAKKSIDLSVFNVDTEDVAKVAEERAEREAAEKAAAEKAAAEDKENSTESSNPPSTTDDAGTQADAQPTEASAFDHLFADEMPLPPAEEEVEFNMEDQVMIPDEMADSLAGKASEGATRKTPAKSQAVQEEGALALAPTKAKAKPKRKKFKVAIKSKGKKR